MIKRKFTLPKPRHHIMVSREREIENEVQARLIFKFNDIKDAIENRISFSDYFQKVRMAEYLKNGQHNPRYYEDTEALTRAYKELRTVLHDECNASIPHNDMNAVSMRKKRDKAIDKIMNMFTNRGDRNYQHKERVLVGVLKELMQ